MNEWKFQMRRKKRGDHCCFVYTDQDGQPRSCLCGRGTRHEPPKRKKIRIVKRALMNQLKRQIREEI